MHKMPRRNQAGEKLFDAAATMPPRINSPDEKVPHLERCVLARGGGAAAGVVWRAALPRALSPPRPAPHSACKTPLISRAAGEALSGWGKQAVSYVMFEQGTQDGVSFSRLCLPSRPSASAVGVPVRVRVTVTTTR